LTEEAVSLQKELANHPRWDDGLLGTLNSGLLMDRIVSSPIVEEVLLRADDEFYLNIWWIGGDEEDLVGLQHSNKYQVLLVGMIEVLSREELHEKSNCESA
jgi:hypothetical protein